MKHVHQFSGKEKIFIQALSKGAKRQKIGFPLFFSFTEKEINFTYKWPVSKIMSPRCHRGLEKIKAPIQFL